MSATEIIEDLTGVELIEVIVEGPAGPSGDASLTANVSAALTGADAPSATNVFATTSDAIKWAIVLGG